MLKIATSNSPPRSLGYLRPQADREQLNLYPSIKRLIRLEIC